MSSFVITDLEILPECNYKHRKNLSAGTYRFVTHPEPGFFGQNISLQAIVGMNGAGKSTLLDMIIRMANNFGALIFAPLHDEGCDYRYVCGVHAILNYMIENLQGTLECRGDELCLKLDNQELRCDIRSGVEYYVKGRRKDVGEQIIHDMASKFFYTVVGNYSMQSFISSDYSAEKSYRFSRKFGRWVVDNNSIWLDTVFHKNDGYMMPVTLNPFRDNGTIDMYNESELAQYRITSLLIEFDRQQMEYPVGYRLTNIEYKYDWRKLVSRFMKQTRGESYSRRYRELLDNIKNNCLLQKPDYTFCDVIFESFNIADFSTHDDEMLWMARLYLVSKIISIGKTYPSYVAYRYLCDYNRVFDPVSGDERRRIKSLCKKVKDDNSHIGVKIRQIRFFITQFNKCPDVGKLYETFTYADYAAWLNVPDLEHSVVDRMRFLPPALFTPTIYLRKSEVKTKHYKKNNNIPFSSLSSGEKQFLHTTSVFLYHILNLRSVKGNRIRYKYFNLILDEVEICFHPEYQRRFVNDFLNLLKGLSLNNKFGINIILTTHSPFILSDIPKSNILYLEDGKSVSNARMLNPFAANVNDILRQSFFLKNGFMGALAQRKIKRLITFLNNNHNDETDVDMNLAVNLIDRVGDPLLRARLHTMLDDFYCRHPELVVSKVQIRKKIDELQCEIDKLKTMLGE